MSAALNSVRMYAEDASGLQHCFTLAANRPEVIAAFRKHVTAWQRYVRTKEGLKAYAKCPHRMPCFPVRVVVEPYHDATAT